MTYNLFFILIFALILLIIFFLRDWFFFQFYPSTFDLLGIGLCGFSICGASDLMTGKEFEKLMWFGSHFS